MGHLEHSTGLVNEACSSYPQGRGEKQVKAGSILLRYIQRKLKGSFLIGRLKWGRSKRWRKLIHSVGAGDWGVR